MFAKVLEPMLRHTIERIPMGIDIIIGQVGEIITHLRERGDIGAGIDLRVVSYFNPFIFLNNS